MQGINTALAVHIGAELFAAGAIVFYIRKVEGGLQDQIKQLAVALRETQDTVKQLQQLVISHEAFIRKVTGGPPLPNGNPGQNTGGVSGQHPRSNNPPPQSPQQPDVDPSTLDGALDEELSQLKVSSKTEQSPPKEIRVNAPPKLKKKSVGKKHVPRTTQDDDQQSE